MWHICYVCIFAEQRDAIARGCLLYLCRQTIYVYTLIDGETKIVEERIIASGAHFGDREHKSQCIE